MSLRRQKQKSFRINEKQLQKLKTSSKKITILEKKSKYEQFRGKIDNSSVVVYKGKHGLTLVIQNFSRKVEKKIEGIIGKEKRKIIEIDDTGWGEPVGGVFIIGRDIESGKFSKEEIPVEFFQKGKFKSGAYSIEAVKAVNKILDDLNVTPNKNFIRICSGTIFSQVYKFLEKNGYSYEITKIRGETQKLAEKIFNQYLEKINCPRGYKRMIKWLETNPNERRMYAKTGWKKMIMKY
jgi:hypothetical protein